MSNLQAQQLLRLTVLLQLEKRVRAANADELAFIMVNETLSVVSYRQALLWRGTPSKRIVAASGVSLPDANAPYIVWAARLCAHLEGDASKELREIKFSDVPPEIAAEWNEWAAANMVWVPLPPHLGALVLARDEPLSETDRNLLILLADAYAHAWRGLLSKRSLREKVIVPTGRRRRLMIAGGIVLLLALSLFPVRQSVLAPAEIIPREPVVARAPLEGVVDQVLVTPNQQVAEGQTLFALDPRRLRNQLAVSLRAQEAAEAELRQARQLSVVDQKARATLPTLQGKLDQQAAEVVYLREQLERIDVKASQAGLAIFDDPNDWLGRPVAVGERVMLIADPQKVEVEVRLPAADAIDLENEAPVRLFLNIDPERARDATLTFASYQAQKGPDGILAYRVKARFDEGEPLPRIGLKGTAKLYAAHVPLIYAILRRPIAALRQWIGL
jgi:hypothetical protein